MKNKAGLLAVIVLGVAMILMFFLVLPRLSEDDKVARQAAAATQSIKELTDLFVDGKLPQNDAFAAARTKVEDALKALATVKIPDTLDDITSQLITTARAAAQAAAQVPRLVGIFADTDSRQPLPSSEKVQAGLQQPFNESQPRARPGSETAQAPATVPSFDVLWVDPDVYAVIAGKAAPGAKLEVLKDGALILQTAVDDSGNFATVLDKPLPPGDHTLVLRASENNSEVAHSQETATVSIPAAKNGELLAMVSKPGEASGVLAMPEDAAPQAQTGASATVQPTSSSGVAPVAAPAALVLPAIHVTAVEFEGSRIFVAGSALAGSTIRALVDGTRIGETVTEATGKFVIKGTVELAVGDHLVAAEMLDAVGNVVVWVRVPFVRTNTDQATAVQQAAAAIAAVPLENQSTLADRAAFEALRDGVNRAFAILTGLYADGGKPTLDEVAAARSATAIALGSLSEFRSAAATNADIAAKAKALLAMVKDLPNNVSAIGHTLAGLKSRMAELNAPAPVPGPATFNDQPAAATRCGKSRGASMARSCATRPFISPIRTRSKIQT